MKLIAIIILLIYLSSCTVIRTYDMKDKYSEVNPPSIDRVYMEQKIQALLCILNQCNNNRLKYYILNGQYFTIKIRKRDKKRIDRLVQATLCKQSPVTQCTRCN